MAGIFIYHRIVPKPAKAAQSREELARKSHQYADNPQPGDLVLVYLFEGRQQALFKITAIDPAGDKIRAIPSDKSIDVPANAPEVPATDLDFKPGNEKSFSLKEFKSLRLTSANDDRLGNIQMVYRK